MSSARLRKSHSSFFIDNRLRVRFVSRGTGCVKVCRRGRWVKLNRLGFAGNARHHGLGHIQYCQRSPCRLWITMSRARDRRRQWGIWYLVSNRGLPARRAAAEYARRGCCEIVFPQMTKAHFFTSRAGRDHVADFDLPVVDDHAVDQQLDQLPPPGEVQLG